MRASVNSIQFLRFIAAALVVFSHAMDDSKYYITDSVSPIMHYIGDFGRSGVHIFFVISGFIMVYTSFEKEFGNFDSSTFLLRRFLRIYPIYWIYSAAYILFRQIVSEGYGSIWNVLGSLLLFPGYSYLIISQGWTLSYEVYFYICFGFFMMLGLLRGLLVMSLFFLVAIAVGLVFHSDSAGFHLVTNSLLVEFLFGAWIAYFFVLDARLSTTLSNVILLLGLGIFSGGLAFGYNRFPSVLMWGAPSALLIAGSVFNERGGNLPVFIQRYSYLGDSSYSLYLLHVLLIGVMLTVFRAVLPNFGSDYIAICLVLTVLCILIAVVSYELIERRLVGFLQTIVRNIQRRRVTRHVG